MANFISQYTGEQVEQAVAAALLLVGRSFDGYTEVSDESISGVVYRVFWKVAPTDSNTVYGVTVHPVTGVLTTIRSANNSKVAYKYVTEEDTISKSEIDDLFK